MSSLIRSIQDVITSVRELHKKKLSKKIYERVNFFVHFIIFDMSIIKTDEYLLTKFFIFEPDFLRLLLLKLKLYLLYEDSFLFLSFNSFHILKLYIFTYLDRLPQNEYESEETVQLTELLFLVGSRIYSADTALNGLFHINLINSSLLSHLQDTFLIYTGNFWKAYFDYKYSQSTEESSKLRTVEVCEILIFYSYFLSKNMDFTCKMMESYIPVKSINMNLICRNVTAKVGKVLYKANNLNARSSEKRKKTKDTKMIETILLCIKKGFISKSDVCSLVLLNKATSKGVLKGIVKTFLHQEKVDPQERLAYWLRYARLDGDSGPLRMQPVPVTKLSEEQIEQIHIDMIRTKQWKGEAYQHELETLAVDFLCRYEINLDYFQGFNYILSFFYDFVEDKNSLFTLLHFATNRIVTVS